MHVAGKATVGERVARLEGWKAAVEEQLADMHDFITNHLPSALQDCRKEINDINKTVNGRLKRIEFAAAVCIGFALALGGKEVVQAVAPLLGG